MNRSRRIYKLAVILTFALGAIAGAYNDPPIAIIVSSPDFYPLAQFVAGGQGGSGGGASYDPDNLIGGIWYGYNHGITSYDWSFSPNPQWWNYSTWNHSGVYFKYSSVGKKTVSLTVEDDDSPTGYGATQCNVWVFQVDLNIANSIIGVGDTTELSLAYTLADLYAGYKRLSVNPLVA